MAVNIISIAEKIFNANIPNGGGLVLVGTFDIGPHTCKIYAGYGESKGEGDNRYSIWGQSQQAENSIWVATHHAESGTRLPFSTVLATLIHELIHIILDLSNYPELSSNEPLVTALGNGLAQLLMTIDAQNEPNEQIDSTNKDS